MIKIEHIVLSSPEQMEFIIEGMRNPMNSWEKSDSISCNDCYAECRDRGPNGENLCNECILSKNEHQGFDILIGPNDADLMRRLCKGGSVHRKYMRMMKIYMRVTAPLYWWKEFDTYKVGTNCNSCSTMHKIQAKEFTLEDFSTEHLTKDSLDILDETICWLNTSRDHYLYSGDKTDWWQMIQLLPSSYNQTRNVEFDYETAANIYKWRHVHKLDEWVEFCKVLETLPYSDLIMEDANHETEN